MHIAIDLDGTVFEDKYPELGDLLPNSKSVINYWYERGHKIIINTCRANHFADNAKAYLTYNGIKYDFFNENNPQLIQKYNTDTRKISADFYVDDKSLNDLTLRKMIGVEGYNNTLWQTALEQVEFIEKPVILCIIGESGAGKSISAKYLEDTYGINVVNSYTNRIKRNEKDIDHVFLNTKQYNNLYGEKLAETTFGEEGKTQYKYCSLVNDMTHFNSYIITEDGLVQLRQKWSAVFDIYALRIKRPLYDRICDVGEDRCRRDVGRFNLYDNDFDCIIHNDVNDKLYLYKEIDKFMNTSRLTGRCREYSTLI